MLLPTLVRLILETWRYIPKHFNSCTTEVWEWIINFTPNLIIRCIISCCLYFIKDDQKHWFFLQNLNHELIQRMVTYIWLLDKCRCSNAWTTNSTLTNQVRSSSFDLVAETESLANWATDPGSSGGFSLHWHQRISNWSAFTWLHACK